MEGGNLSLQGPLHRLRLHSWGPTVTIRSQGHLITFIPATAVSHLLVLLCLCVHRG